LLQEGSNFFWHICLIYKHTLFTLYHNFLSLFSTAVFLNNDLQTVPPGSLGYVLPGYGPRFATNSKNDLRNVRALLENDAMVLGLQRAARRPLHDRTVTLQHIQQIVAEIQSQPGGPPEQPPEIGDVRFHDNLPHTVLREGELAQVPDGQGKQPIAHRVGHLADGALEQRVQQHVVLIEQRDERTCVTVACRYRVDHDRMEPLLLSVSCGKSVLNLTRARTQQTTDDQLRGAGVIPSATQHPQPCQPIDISAQHVRQPAARSSFIPVG
uniref:Uncharacterized protein n=1 Tax=Anopheles coluzzii TaxID=1518534 RepID=A0A8W7P8G4_ANOCL